MTDKEQFHKKPQKTKKNENNPCETEQNTDKLKVIESMTYVN